MKTKPTRSFRHGATLLFVTSLLIAAAQTRAQAPNALEHTIAAPPTGAQTGAQLGYSVATEGNLTVLGAPFDDLQGINSGVVKVFDSSTGELLHVIANPSPAQNDQFGESVSISGTLVVVGARLDDTGATDAGTAYVYDLSSGTPTVPVATLNKPGPAAGDFFGFSVSISGTLVVVGAFRDDTGATDAGSAYVYDLSSGTPTVPVATLNNPGPAVSDGFGESVSISGTLVVVGANRDDPGAADAGSAYVYDLNSGTPTVPVATLNNPSPAPQDQFGFSVSISGMMVVVGTMLDDTGATNAGRAYVYDLSSETPTVPAGILDNPGAAVGDQFGFSVSISGTLVVVGSLFDDTGATDAGSAYVYDLSSGTPTVPVATLNNPGPAAGDQFGVSVAISGTRAAIGAPLDDSTQADKGSAYIFAPGNIAPVAQNQAVSTNEDTAKSITLTASDANGDSLTFSVVSDPTNGMLTGTAPNLTYTPNANYNGPDSFTFKANDGQVDSNTATVSITVTAVNDPPVANGQSVTTNEDTAKAITLSASDADGNGLIFSVVTQPTNGTLSGTAPNLTYTPNANYNGPDSFTFKANDGTEDSNTATVSITVTAVNDAPVANGQSVTTNEDTGKAITLSGSDVDGDALTFSVVTQPTHGSLSGTAPNLTYTPNANYNGPDSFFFKANDGTEDSNTATVSITVTAVNDAPVITAGAAVARQQGSAGTTATIATVSDQEQSAGSLTVTATNVPSGISVTGISNNSGTVTATVAANCSATVGTNPIQLTVTDSNGETSTASFMVNVTANTAPTLTYNNAAVNKGGSTTINPTSGPTDNGSVTSIIVQSQGAYSGTISVNSAGVVSVSNATPKGFHTITIRATDNCNVTRDATFILEVRQNKEKP